MEKIFNKISVVMGIAGGFLCNQLGGLDILLKTILILVALDYVTGIIKGIYEKNLSSEIGFKGILKKIMIFIVIATAWTIQKLLGEVIALREIAIMFFVINEALSLLENAAVLIPIPDKLKDTLLQLREKKEE